MRRAGARDGAEVLDQLLAAHADPIVGDCEGAPLGIGLEHDPEGSVLAEERGLGQCEVAETVAGIRGVRDQLSEEDLFLAIERMGDDIEEAAHLRLKSALLRSHGLSIRPVGIAAHI